MNKNENDIIEISKKIMKSIGWKYDKNKKLHAGLHSFEEQYKNLNSVRDSGFLSVDYDVIKSSIKEYWTICFDFEPEAELEKNFMFLDIDDETSEPIKISHKQFSGKILKNTEGEYYVDK